MAVKKLVALLIVSGILVSCKSAFVDTLTKCSTSGHKCLKNQIQSIVRNGMKGISELNIKPIDPFEIKNLHIDILDLINITLTDGTVKGIKNCDILKYIINFDTGHAFVEGLCDISIKGKYKASSSSPLIKTFFGADSVHGDGNGKIKIEKLKISFDFTFDVVKRDGELYMNCDFDKTKYTFDILGKVQFHADNLYLGKEESSQSIVKLMNENWRTIMESVGKKFMDVAMGYVYDFTKDILNKISLNKLIIEKDFDKLHVVT